MIRSDVVVRALAEMVMTNATLRVDEKVRRPKLVVERAPDGERAVDRHRIGHAELLNGVAHVVDVLFERELRRMHADDDQPVILVLVGPRLNVGKRAKAVDARVRPEVDDDDLAAQTFRRERRRVEPRIRAGQRRHLSFDGNRAPGNRVRASSCRSDARERAALPRGPSCCRARASSEVRCRVQSRWRPRRAAPRLPIRDEPIRRRRAIASSRRTRVRRRAVRRRATSLRPARTRAAGASCLRWRPESRHRSGRGQGSVLRTAPTACRPQCPDRNDEPMSAPDRDSRSDVARDDFRSRRADASPARRSSERAASRRRSSARPSRRFVRTDSREPPSRRRSRRASPRRRTSPPFPAASANCS